MWNLYNSGTKKPAGTAEDISKHFGCEPSRLIMVKAIHSILELIEGIIMRLHEKKLPFQSLPAL